ncbi:uncharacterized protein LOC142317656 [Lycorma delicatula]|uniref:uncharacterized protein LOC142317656 n=1 Tax=Lycorma delicatula TaxID=130591 RepID=UPI003F5138A2
MSNSQAIEKESEPRNAPNVVATCSSKNQEVILATAIMLVADFQGNYYPGCALLDSGSQSNFISQSFAAALGIQQVKTSTSVICIGNSNTSAKYSVRTTTKSRFGNFEEELELLVLKRIAYDLPTSSIHKKFNIPNEVNLADKHFYKCRGIELLIGASIFYNTIIEGQIKHGSNLPVLQNTEFGWIVSRTITSGKSREIEINSITTITHCSIAALNNLEDLISSFWRIEELPIERSKTFEEEACEQNYTNHVKRQSDGRFIVSLPFFTDPTITLGDSKEHAIKRLRSLEQRFSRQPELKQAYTEFLNEYLENGEMEQATSLHEPNLTYYLPHHPVIKESSSSTRLRVVFDASSKTSTDNSLNNVLMIGPTFQRDIVTILLSFRIPIYVFTADKKQMYR